jgi:hypothetical protein
MGCHTWHHSCTPLVWNTHCFSIRYLDCNLFFFHWRQGDLDKFSNCFPSWGSLYFSYFFRSEVWAWEDSTGLGDKLQSGGWPFDALSCEWGMAAVPLRTDMSLVYAWEKVNAFFHGRQCRGRVGNILTLTWAVASVMCFIHLLKREPTVTRAEDSVVGFLSLLRPNVPLELDMCLINGHSEWALNFFLWST